jgi:hypothetical protein
LSIPFPGNKNKVSFVTNMEMFRIGLRVGGRNLNQRPGNVGVVFHGFFDTNEDILGDARRILGHLVELFLD